MNHFSSATSRILSSGQSTTETRVVFTRCTWGCQAALRLEPDHRILAGSCGPRARRLVTAGALATLTHALKAVDVSGRVEQDKALHISPVRGERLDAQVPSGGDPLRWLREFLADYHNDRTHLSLGKDPPTTRAVCPPTSPYTTVASLPRVGSLHHRYGWREAA